MLSTPLSRFGLLPVFLCGAVLAVLSPVFWLTTRLPDAPQARTYENTALYERVLPSVHYTYERLRAGEWPLWNPWSLCGTEHLANPRNGVFQPLNLIFLILPTELGLAAHGFLCAFLGALALLLFLRSMEVRFAPAFLGACVYAFSGASAAALSFPDYAAFLVWLPMCFWGVRSVALGRAHAGAWLGVTLALLFFSGALDALLASGLVMVAYAVTISLSRNGRREQTLGRSARRFRNAILLACALAAVQLVPYLGWAWEHGALWPFAGSDLQAALPNGARKLVQQLFDVQGDALLPPLLYFGVTALLVLPTALFHRQARTDAIFFVGATAVALLLVVYGRMGWDARVPFEAFAFPATFGAAVLAALGADRLFETGRDPRSPNVWGPVLVVTLCGAIIFYFLPSMGRGITALFFLAAVVPSVVVRLRWLAAACTAIAAMLTFVDLATALSQHALHPFAEMPGALAAHDKELRTSQAQIINGRAIISTRPLDGTLMQNVGPLRDLRCAGAAMAALTPVQRLWWERLGNPEDEDGKNVEAWVSATASQPRLLNYMAVRAAVATPESPLLARKWGESAPRLREAISGGSFHVLVNDDALPRAYWTPQWRSADSLEAAMTLLTSADFHPEKECVVQAEGNALAQLVSAVPPGNGTVDWELVGCNIALDTPERIELKVSAPAAGVTVLADTFAPGWRAEVNGKSTPILKVNGLFRGVVTPAGESTIVFRYRPLGFYFGAMVSVLSLLLLFLWFAVRLLFRPTPAASS